jgi:hypothetical protein
MRAQCSKLMIAAARLPARRLPANSQFDRPIGVPSNFRKLWEEGLGRLAAVYVLSLFGFVIWVGLAISWIFFAGIKPPLVAG